MAIELFDSQSAKAFTASANKIGGLETGEVNLAVLGRANMGWDAPLPPPQKIDFEGIMAEAREDMNAKFSDLPKLKGYWAQSAAPVSNTPSFMQSPVAAEPQVFYPSEEPKISMDGLSRAQQYEAPLNSFNSGANKPAVFTSRFNNNGSRPA